MNVSDGTGVHSVDPESEDVPDEPDWAEPSVRNHLCLVLLEDGLLFSGDHILSGLSLIHI